ncbi:MAG: serine hydrolase domain-containing protein [Longimicrobiales bacterium]
MDARVLRLCLALPLLGLPPSSAAAQTGAARYYPGPDAEWERRAPADVGMDASLIAEAIAFARDSETPGTRDLEEAHYLSFGREPYGEAIGAFKPRGEQTGVILRHGYIIAEWGEPQRVDMTFSVTKSFLSTTVGLAHDRGLIGAVSDTVAGYMAPVVAAPWVAGIAGSVRAANADGAGGERLGDVAPFELFSSAHNRRITWDDLLRQVSDWEGTLWGKPDWADRPSGEPATWRTRERNTPGSVFEYNDVRVNLLALAATNVWRRPLPEVLREHVMDPIAASPTWRWHGYENSWIVIDGSAVQAVSGGGHWGGGMFISARDQARFGLLTLRRGRWDGRQILSEEWITMATTPTPANPGYGFMNFFLNTGRELLPSAPEDVWVHLGAGTNMIYCDPVNDLIIVSRWVRRDAMDGIVARVLSALTAAEQ